MAVGGLIEIRVTVCIIGGGMTSIGRGRNPFKNKKIIKRPKF